MIIFFNKFDRIESFCLLYFFAQAVQSTDGRAVRFYRGPMLRYFNILSKSVPRIALATSYSPAWSASFRVTSVVTDTKNSVGLVGCIEEVAHNAIAVYWNPLESSAKVRNAGNVDSRYLLSDTRVPEPSPILFPVYISLIAVRSCATRKYRIARAFDRVAIYRKR